MEVSERVFVSGVEHRLNRSPSNAPAPQPHERPEAQRQSGHLKGLIGRQRVEIAREDVKPMLMPFDALKQRAELVHSPPLGPRRVNRTEVDAKHPRLAVPGHNLDERMPRDTWSMP
jgi:hypothetical protein